MANEIVKHSSKLNDIVLRKFTPIEQNLFISIVSRAFEKGENVITFSFNDLKDLSKYNKNNQDRFLADLERSYDKFFDLIFTQRTDKILRKFVMFNQFEINKENETVQIKINDVALPLFNDLNTWVRYSLQEFVELKSSYSKTMYRLLKQYRTGGWYEISKNDFFVLLDIPKSYEKKMTNVDQFVLKPIKEELSAIFQGLKITKKHGTGRGKPVVAYRFDWKAEAKNANDFYKGSNYVSDVQTKIKNLEHNAEISDIQRWEQTDRLKRKPIGTTELQTVEKPITETAKKLQDKRATEKLSFNKITRTTLRQISNLTDEQINTRIAWLLAYQDEIQFRHPNYSKTNRALIKLVAEQRKRKEELEAESAYNDMINRLDRF